LEEEKKFVDG